MKRLLLVLAFTLALAAPATAHAALKYSQAVAIAEATWPGSPCQGQEKIFRRADGVINGMDAIDGIDSAARAEPWNCTVYLRAGLEEETSDWFCTYLTHEIGHL